MLTVLSWASGWLPLWCLVPLTGLAILWCLICARALWTWATFHFAVFRFHREEERYRKHLEKHPLQ